MSYTTLFKRWDGTGYVAVNLGRDGEAVAYGNGYDTQSQTDIFVRNTITHAHVSAELAFNHLIAA